MCKQWQLSLISVLILGATVSNVYGKPNLINFGTFMCPREPVALGRCLRDNLNKYIPKLAKGVPEFSIPSCEPLLIPEVSFHQTRGPVMVESQYSDITVKGPSAMRIREIEIDAPNHRIIAYMHIPKLETKGRYSIRGQILMLPIEGEGMCTGNYSEIEATTVITIGRAPRPWGPDALACEDLQVNFQIGNADVQMENLFGGDDRMGKTMNRFLNENWNKIQSELQPALEDSLRNFLKTLADKAFSNLNADDILGDKED